MLGSQISHFRITAKLGEGGMGEVYKALDTRIGREVAVKVLPRSLARDPDRVRRFEQEARAAAALNHPNILTLLDLGTTEGSPFLVYELLSGETLRYHLAGGGLPPDRVIEYAMQLVRGLAAAHGRGIVHRDLKPENVFVTRDDRVKILDFGLAKLTAGPQEEAETLTRWETTPGTVLGTVGYMAPEQVRGADADHRADLFALGAILYEMLCGRRAFSGPSAADVLAAILHEEPPTLARGAGGTLGDLEAIAGRCLAKDPDARYQQARDVEQALLGVTEVAEAMPSPSSGRTSTLAVLPFEDLTGDPELAQLGLGLADAVITELARLGSLVVRPTSAVVQLPRDLAPQEAGRRLEVDSVVDGRLQSSGRRLRLTAQLIDTETASSLWGAKFDTEMADVFEAQDEISQRVVETLALEVTPGERRRLATAPRPGGDSYRLYLEGRARLCSETAEDFQAAADAFDRAVRADPDFALAWAGLADASARMAFSFDPEGDWYRRAQQACDRALTIDPQLPEGHYVRGRLVWSPQGSFDHAEGLRAYMTAIRGRPSLHDAHHYLGHVLFHVSMQDEAGRALERALDISPHDRVVRGHLGICRLLQGRYLEAVEISDTAARQVPSAWAFYQLALARSRLGDWGGVATALEEGERRFPDEGLFQALWGLLAAREADAADARARVRRTVEHKEAFGHYHHAQHDIACVFAALGETDQALDWLEQAAANGFPCGRFFEMDPLLEPLHGESGFERLVEKLEVECDAYRRLYRELQAAGSDPVGPGP